MSVLFVMPNWAGGSELWMQRMLEALGDGLGAIACREAPQDRWRGRVPVVNIADDEATSRRELAGAITAHKITRVLVHYLPWGLRLAPVWRECGVPVWVHAHGYDVTWDRRRPEPPHDRQFDNKYPARVVELSRHAMIIANSHCTAAKLVAIGVGSDRIMVKYLGVPVPAKDPTRQRRGDPLALLYLGRLVDFKGPVETIAAFERASERGLIGRLIMAGDGPLRAECEARARASRWADRIMLPGEVDETTGQRLRTTADVFTAHNQRGPVTRQEEAYGVAFVEAMAAGLPVVSGRSGSLGEIVEHEREGILFEPGDVEAHAEALRRLGDDDALRCRLGRAGWVRAGAQFSDVIERVALRNILRLEGVRRS